MKAMFVAATAFIPGAWLVAQLPPPQQGLLPPAANHRVDFAREIQPIFEASCVQCHARGKDKGAFSLETKDDFLAGGDSGPPATIGHSAGSRLIQLVSGLDPEEVMPKKGKRLTPEQVGVLRAWIDQGMAWPADIAFHKHAPSNLRTHEVTPPSSPGTSNPVDAFVAAYFAQHDEKWPGLVDDRTFARRAWLDAVGLLPPPAELNDFLADTTPDKRQRLVNGLLGDNQRYAEHWLTFWNDLLRNDYRGTGYIDGGRKAITPWLYTALARNLPYDKFVAQLVDPGAESEGFAHGITWRGAVNASMVPPMQAAQGVAQVFLGVNLKCASCHDSFISEYTLADSYGLAAVYSDGPLEIAECDKPTGQISRVKFLYDELGGFDTNADPAARRRRLAELITGRSNGRLPRTIVNRVWQRFMGVGLVEPVDEMDRPAWAPRLLDWLAEDLVAHGYDLKHLMAQIMTSRAYQLPAVNVGEATENFVFRGPAVRRLSAEQFVDALTTVAGLTYAKPDAKLNRAVALHPSRAGELPWPPQWIWSDANAPVKTAPATLVFRRMVTLPVKPTEAWLTLAADDNFTVTVNGRAAGNSPRRNSTGAMTLNATALFTAGPNRVEITVANLGRDDLKVDVQKEDESAAGLILYARVRAEGAVMDFVSDRSWTATNKDVSLPVVELGGVDLSPWRVGPAFLDLAAGTPDTLPVERAALLAADPLTAALGRPNREQIVTVRQATATTLQALELTNGATLADVLQRGAEKIAATSPHDGRGLVSRLYAAMLGRPPTAAEIALAEPVVGSPVQVQGVADLWWALAMLPEFQLIH